MDPWLLFDSRFWISSSDVAVGREGTKKWPVSESLNAGGAM